MYPIMQPLFEKYNSILPFKFSTPSVESTTTPIVKKETKDAQQFNIALAKEAFEDLFSTSNFLGDDFDFEIFNTSDSSSSTINNPPRLC